MAKEFRLLGAATGATVYGVLTRDSDELVWQTTTSTFVTRVNADQANYDLTMTETPSGSRIWFGDFPAGIVDDGQVVYHVEYRQQLAGSPSADDDILGTEDVRSSGAVSTPSPSTGGLITDDEYDAMMPDHELTPTQVDWLIDAATRVIEDYVGYTLLAEVDKEETLDGTGFNFLQLRGRPSSITSVIEDPYATTPTTIAGSNFAFTSANQLYFKESSTAGSAFTAGKQNYKVTYTTSGTVNYDLKFACVQVINTMARMVDPDLLVSEKAVGDVKVKYQAPLYVDLMNPLFSDVASILNKYRVPLCI
jgi:hypothetical protein